MNPWDNIPTEIDEHTERLIVRYLDGEIGEFEQAELDGILTVNSAARDLLEEYRRNDLVAAECLRSDLGRPQLKSQKPRIMGGFRLAAFSAVLTAAAVIALSFIPSFFSTPASHGPVAREEFAGGRPMEVPHNQQLVDYKPNANFSPMRRDIDLRRDLIGVRGESPNVIYLFERSRASTKLSPVSGDF